MAWSGSRFRQSSKDSRSERTRPEAIASVDAGEYRRLYSNVMKAERETVEL